MLPTAEVSEVAQDDVSEERYPDLPLHGLLIVANEVAELYTLLEFLEEDLYRPTTLVEIADAAGSQVHVVGDEDHNLLFTVDEHSCFDPSKSLRVRSFTL